MLDMIKNLIQPKQQRIEKKREIVKGIADYRVVQSSDGEFGWQSKYRGEWCDPYPKPSEEAALDAIIYLHKFELKGLETKNKEWRAV